MLSSMNNNHIHREMPDEALSVYPCPARPFSDFAGYLRLMSQKRKMLEDRIEPAFFSTHDGVNAGVVNCGNRELLNFSGYNYLGLSGDPRVSEAAKRAIDQHGTSVSASRVVAGQIPAHDELERKIAKFLGTERSLVFISGYGTNVATISHLFGRHDLVVHDELAHNSIVTGCQLSGARRLRFPHNDWEALDSLLNRHRRHYRRTLVVIEALYSMDGDIPDLPQVIELKRRHDILLMVDEAHSLGTLGRTGRGIGEQFNVDRRAVDIWMGSLSKSLASSGGYIAGDHELIEYLRYLGPGFIFSVGLSPPDTVAALTALDILQRDPGLVSQLHSRSMFFYQCAKEAGLHILGSPETPVKPLIVGHSPTAMRLSQRLLELGIQVQPIIYPAVRENRARLRFFVTCMHTEDQIASTVATVARELKILDEAEG